MSNAVYEVDVKRGTLDFQGLICDQHPDILLAATIWGKVEKLHDEERDMVCEAPGCTADLEWRVNWEIYWKQQGFEVERCSCKDCPAKKTCQFAFDLYNLDGDCLAEK